MRSGPLFRLRAIGDPRVRLARAARRMGGFILRRKALAGAVGVALLVALLAVPLALRAKPSGRPAQIFQAEGCNEAPAIDAPAGGRADDPWRRLALPPDAQCADLKATKGDAAGVPQDTSFFLTLAEPIDAATVGTRLVAEPAVTFDVRSDSPTRHRIIPRHPLTEGTLYRFALLEAPGGRPVQRWAFQTRSPLRVAQTLPRDEATGVPLDIGIELTFTHDGVTGARERFSISPRTEGRFEMHKRVLVFVPKQLMPLTLYTVTLRPGASVPGTKERIERPFSFRFETGTEERPEDTPFEPTLGFGRAVWESPTADAPVASLYFSGGPDAKPPASAPITVYRFDGVDAFLASLGGFTSIPTWASATRANFIASTKGLQKVLSFNGRLQALGEGGDLYVRFPAALSAGFYLVRAEHDRVTTESWLQVTDIATYAAVSGTRTLVWVNDIASKRPVAGASIEVAGAGAAGTTNRDGVSSFATPRALLTLRPDRLGEAPEILGNLVVRAGGRIAVAPLADIFSGRQSFDFRRYSFAGDPAPYWRYLYVDRDLYHPTDSVRFWGLVRKRGASLGRQQIVLEMTTWDDRAQGPVAVATTAVTTTERGTFIGELPFAGVTPGYYEIEARIGNQTITSTSITVADFVKPAYKIDVTPSKRAIVAGETVRLDVAASFFEGSPVPNLQLKYNVDYGEASGELTTDAEGRASMTDRPPPPRDSGFFRTLQFSPARSEEGAISGEGTVRVFASTLDIEASGTQANDRARVEGTVFGVDFARLNRGADADPFDYRGPPAGGRRVTATVTEVSWQREVSGASYDFVAKKVVKTYSYHDVRRARGSYTDTSDARGRFSFSFPADAKRSYEVVLRVADAAGRVAKTTAWVSSGFGAHNPFAYLAGLTEGPYGVGDSVSVAMRRGQADLPSGGPNRYLFYRAAAGIRDATVRREPRYSFRFSEADIPNVDVFVVRFNGVTYEESSDLYEAGFDAELRRLRISISADRTLYRPGETARLSVRVTDRNGRPVQAEVLLSAVDEALYRLHPDTFFEDRDILTALYERVDAGLFGAYASHQYPRTAPLGEMGGEGPDRTDFRDVGIFTRVTTDADGRATAPFKLPDNLTSWRITALAVGDRLEAGSATAGLPVGLPVFADAGLNDSYLVSDRPFARVRAFGTELRPGDRVDFRMEIPTLSPKPITGSGVAFQPVDLALPRLREGRHKVSVTVSARGRRDTIVRTIAVVPSRLMHIKADTEELTPGARFTPDGSADGPTTVVVSDHNRGRYYPALEQLSWTYGDRVDQMLARKVAQELLAEHFGEPSPFPALFRASAYQTEKGGISIFPFADADLILSARVAALAPDRFGRTKLASYFATVLADSKETRERGVVALYGAAALGEPVLLDVRRASAERNLSVRERLFMALAAQELGDDATASSIYRDLLQRYGEVRGATVRLNVGKDQDDVLEATSLAAILGAGLGDDAAAAMFDYTSRTGATDTLLGLEQISYLVAALPRLPAAPSRIAYTLDGKRQTRDLSRGESVVLTLTPAQRRALRLEVLDGRAGISTSYLAPFRPRDVHADPAAAITREWNESTARRVRLHDGDLVQITLVYRLGPKAIDGCYQVTDILPSGLRAVTDPFTRGMEIAEDDHVSYPYAIEGQRVSFCVSREGDQPALIYYARVTGLGTFTAEPALIQSQRGPELTSLSAPLTVEISR